MKSEQILDALVGAKAKPATEPEASARPRSFIQEALSAFGFGDDTSGAPTSGLGQGFSDARGTLGTWAAKAKEAMGRNPTLTAGALAATAGLLLSGRGRGIMGNVAGVGGLGLIGALAYNAFRRYQDRKAGAAPVDQAALNPANATEQDALLFARVMVAAIAADGRIDGIERARIANGLRNAGLGADGSRWLDQELAKPASIEELSAHATTSEKAAQMYSAARLVIEPDTAEEREFLQGLAQATKLDPALKNEIDGGASGLKASA